MDIEEVRAYAKLLNEENLKVLTIKDGDFKIHLEAHAEESAVSGTPSAPKQSADETDATYTVNAKQVGTFFIEKEENSDETFVSVGDSVSKGDTLGVIEAMKVFNEVKADISGTVEEILVGNGESVEYDQPLFSISKKED
ncbi:acetyl-CoA carboxylase biotin carboxyl carrier protein subunit [Salinicoccus cyprini]|uniref:Acetyl-CoA carboxylase biotin carboxyl carrier protein subunit n=1 Tax=Salinicoccus cyprini TaxID=2493691 RepID=A0A558ATW8_9STAP|nr:biotin/lipoyl-containing protein [Salinicoccus cyprini]TVT27714.1 acetyl-CoA carboxylase biotin carboxyl carrier protein subunit [Salinicoccus cyprini]